MWNRPDYIDWDEVNTQHLEAADLTPSEVETVLDDPNAPAVPDTGAPVDTERWIVFGDTDTGKHIAVIYEVMSEDPFYVHPVTAYEVPDYGDA